MGKLRIPFRGPLQPAAQAAARPARRPPPRPRPPRRRAGWPRAGQGAGRRAGGAHLKAALLALGPWGLARQTRCIRLMCAQASDSPKAYVRQAEAARRELRFNLSFGSRQRTPHAEAQPPSRRLPPRWALPRSPSPASLQPRRREDAAEGDLMSLGNPKSKIQVTEYASASCVHCAARSTTTSSPSSRPSTSTPARCTTPSRSSPSTPLAEVAAAGFLVARCALARTSTSPLLDLHLPQSAGDVHLRRLPRRPSQGGPVGRHDRGAVQQVRVSEPKTRSRRVNARVDRAVKHRTRSPARRRSSSTARKSAVGEVSLAQLDAALIAPPRPPSKRRRRAPPCTSSSRLRLSGFKTSSIPPSSSSPRADRRRRAERLRQVQPARGPALGDGRDPPSACAAAGMDDVIFAGIRAAARRATTPRSR